MKETQVIHSLSLGAGVQSTALYILNANRDERLGAVLPDGRFAERAIFADPGDEGQSTYAHLWKLAGWGSHLLPIYIVRASYPRSITGSLAGDLAVGKRFASIPAYTKADNGSLGILRRQCTEEFKVKPIHKFIRRLAGIQRGKRMTASAFAQIGISLDEVVRMKPSRNHWETKIFPLIDMKWRRIDCLRYLAEVWPHPVGKSSCVFCPYKSNRSWREMKEQRPLDWERACEVDESIRDMEGRGAVRDQLFVHKSAEPLRDAYLDEDQLDIFGEFTGECEGMCGV